MKSADAGMPANDDLLTAGQYTMFNNFREMEV